MLLNLEEMKYWIQIKDCVCSAKAIIYRQGIIHCAFCLKPYDRNFQKDFDEDKFPNVDKLIDKIKKKKI